MMQRRKSSIQRDVLASWLKLSVFAFQTSKYLKEAQAIYNKTQRGTVCFRNVTISYTSSIASKFRKK